MRSRSAVLGVAAGLLVLGASPAHAYLDAGSGSMMLQLLLGGIAGLGVAARLYWQRIKDGLGFRRRETDETEEQH